MVSLGEQPPGAILDDRDLGEGAAEVGESDDAHSVARRVAKVADGDDEFVDGWGDLDPESTEVVADVNRYVCAFDVLVEYATHEHRRETGAGTAVRPSVSWRSSGRLRCAS